MDRAGVRDAGVGKVVTLTACGPTSGAEALGAEGDS